MSFWKTYAVDIDAHKAGKKHEKEIIAAESVQGYDSVEELVAAWNKKNIRFSIDKIWFETALLAALVVTLFMTLLGLIFKKLGILGFSNVGGGLAAIFASGVFLTMYVAFILAVRIAAIRKPQKAINPVVYKAKIVTVYTHGLALSDATRTFVTWPVELVDVLEPEYRGKEGTEVCIVASEDLQIVYGIEYKGQILML